jgi:hypothetical protein
MVADPSRRLAVLTPDPATRHREEATRYAARSEGWP